MVLGDLLHNYDLNSPHIVRLLIVSAIAFGFGCDVYIYCVLLLRRERRSPCPVWLRTFNTPWFYISGLVATGYAIYNLLLVKNFPPKPPLIDGRKTIWCSLVRTARPPRCPSRRRTGSAT